MQVELSIIIPVYNVEKYIIECLKSLLWKKPESVELILVSDGSKDNSVSLIKTVFAEELSHKQFLLLEQENQGVSVARNTGIAHAKGDYIGFVDADDVILPGYYEEILAAIHQGPDLVEIGWKVFENTEELKTNEANFVHKNFGHFHLQDARAAIFAASIWYPVIRFYKRELINQPFFPVGVRFCEDMMALHSLYHSASTAYQIDKALYGYRMNPQGVTRNMNIAYAERMQQFYLEIMPQQEFYYDLLKIAIFYVIYRCEHDTGELIVLDSRIKIDLRRLRLNILRYRIVGRNKLQILLLPRLFKLIHRCKNV